MPKFKIIISVIVLIAALFLLFDKLFTPQPIQITLESGQQITTSTSEYFSLAEVLFLVVSAFLIGSTSIYLFYNSDQIKQINQTASKPDVYEVILPLLKKEEKQVIAALREANGEIQQNKLAVKLNLSKVKVTRLLYSLQNKNLIAKERHGLTNMVKLVK